MITYSYSGIHSRHVAPANIFNLSSTRELNGEKKKFLFRPRIVAEFRIAE